MRTAVGEAARVDDTDVGKAREGDRVAVSLVAVEASTALAPEAGRVRGSVVRPLRFRGGSGLSSVRSRRAAGTSMTRRIARLSFSEEAAP